MSVRATTPGTSPSWIVFALRNTSDKQVERFVTAEREIIRRVTGPTARANASSMSRSLIWPYSALRLAASGSEETCATNVVLTIDANTQIRKELPMGQPVAITATFPAAGFVRG